MPFPNEPVRFVAIVVGIILAALPHLPTFGVPISTEQINALSTFLPTVLVLLGGEAVRAYVVPVSKVPPSNPSPKG